MAIGFLDNDLFREDIIAQAECFGIEVEVTFSYLIVTGLVLGPCDILDAIHGMAPLLRANVVVGGHIRPHVTAIWLWWITIVAR